MQLGTLILAGVCGAVGLVAGRASAPAAPVVVAPAPQIAPVIVVAAPPVVATPDPEPAAPAAEDTEHDDDDGDGTDVAAVLATLNDRAAARPSKQAVLGRLTDWHGEPAVAATIVATSPNLEGERVVLTDEHGEYQVAGLPPGFYTITIYYLDNTFVRTDIASREIEATQLDIALSSPLPREEFVPPEVDRDGIETITGVAPAPPTGPDDVITISGSVAIENGLVDGFM